jgi:hypothetical protein
VRGWPWPAAGKPLFTQEDTDYALALDELEQAEAAERCPSCGLPVTECGNPDNQFRFGAESRRCHATYAIAAAQAKDRDTDEISARSTVWSAGLTPPKT